MNAASACASALRGEKPSSATFDCISAPAGPMPSKVPSAARSSANASVSVAPFTTRPGETPLSSAIIFAWYESAERMSPALASGERLETPGTVRSAGTTCAQSTLPKWAFRCVQASPTAVARSDPLLLHVEGGSADHERGHRRDAEVLHLGARLVVGHDERELVAIQLHREPDGLVGVGAARRDDEQWPVVAGQVDGEGAGFVRGRRSERSATLELGVHLVRGDGAVGDETLHHDAAELPRGLARRQDRFTASTAGDDANGNHSQKNRDNPDSRDSTRHRFPPRPRLCTTVPDT